MSIEALLQSLTIDQKLAQLTAEGSPDRFVKDGKFDADKARKECPHGICGIMRFTYGCRQQCSKNCVCSRLHFPFRFLFSIQETLWRTCKRIPYPKTRSIIKMCENFHYSNKKDDIENEKNEPGFTPSSFDYITERKRLGFG